MQTKPNPYRYQQWPPPAPGPGPGPRRRRTWPWIVATVGVVVIMVGIVASPARSPGSSPGSSDGGRGGDAVRSADSPTSAPTPSPPPLDLVALPPRIVGLEGDVTGTTTPGARVAVTSASTAPSESVADGNGAFAVHVVASNARRAELAITSTAPDGGLSSGTAATMFLHPPAVVSGRGDDVATVPVGAFAIPVAVISHKGSANFIVHAIGPGGREDLLVNEIGSYKGTVEMLEDSRSKATQFEINADGAWQISIEELLGAEERIHAIPGSIDATGDATLYLEASAPVTTMQLSHKGKANFIVKFCPLDGTGSCDLVVNDIGSYSGTVRASTSTGAVLIVQADGPWSASVR